MKKTLIQKLSKKRNKIIEKRKRVIIRRSKREIRKMVRKGLSSSYVSASFYDSDSNYGSESLHKASDELSKLYEDIMFTPTRWDSYLNITIKRLE